MSIDNGGPAFPISKDMTAPNGHSGLTLRDYFIAHAPAEPQVWFQPVMPPKPILPNRFDLDDEQRLQFDGLGDWLDEHDVDKKVRDFAKQYAEACEAQNQWDRERTKLRYVQWPAAWADEMLAARGKSYE